MFLMEKERRVFENVIVQVNLNSKNSKSDPEPFESTEMGWKVGGRFKREETYIYIPMVESC